MITRTGIADVQAPRFAGHETFSLRYGWPKKAVDATAADPQVFTHTKGQDATLACVDQLLRYSSNGELNERLNEFDDPELLVVANNLTPDRQRLNQEFFDLRDIWGDDYPVRLLLRADAQGLRTHTHLCELGVGRPFQMETTVGTKHSILPTQWQRITIGREDTVNGRIPVQAISGDVVAHDVQLFDPDTLVRPLLKPNIGSHCMILPTPEEFRGKIYWKSQSKIAPVACHHHAPRTGNRRRLWP